MDTPKRRRVYRLPFVLASVALPTSAATVDLEPERDG
jgi:hypothetical protein